MIDNNPGLIFDHQIALDSENQILYVFGGTKVHSGPQLNSTGINFYLYHRKISWFMET